MRSANSDVCQPQIRTCEEKNFQLFCAEFFESSWRAKWRILSVPSPPGTLREGLYMPDKISQRAESQRVCPDTSLVIFPKTIVTKTGTSNCILDVKIFCSNTQQTKSTVTSRLAFLLEVLRLPAFASKCGTSTEAWSSTCWVCSWSSTRSTAFFEVPGKRNCERKEWNFKAWKARQHTETTTGRDGGIRHQRCTPLLASNLVESPSIDFSSSWCCQTPENPPVLPRGPNAGQLDLRPDILTPEVRPNIPCIAPRTQPKVC